VGCHWDETILISGLGINLQRQTEENTSGPCKAGAGTNDSGHQGSGENSDDHEFICKLSLPGQDKKLSKDLFGTTLAQLRQYKDPSTAADTMKPVWRIYEHASVALLQ
jgi:hypothetical protein